MIRYVYRIAFSLALQKITVDVNSYANLAKDRVFAL